MATEVAEMALGKQEHVFMEIVRTRPHMTKTKKAGRSKGV